VFPCFSGRRSKRCALAHAAPTRQATGLHAGCGWRGEHINGYEIEPATFSLTPKNNLALTFESLPKNGPQRVFYPSPQHSPYPAPVLRVEAGFGRFFGRYRGVAHDVGLSPRHVPNAEKHCDKTAPVPFTAPVAHPPLSRSLRAAQWLDVGRALR